jgi:hypothetical protein
MKPIRPFFALRTRSSRRDHRLVRHRLRPGLESMENRTLLSVVSSAADSGPHTRACALFSNVVPLAVGVLAASEMDHLGRRTLVRRNDEGGLVGAGRIALPTCANASGRKTSGARVSPASPPASSIAVPGWRRQKMSSVSDLSSL